ncbi:MAG: fumarate hydratase [Spirochaetaceae bacterium]|nr:fumarate hydratase [Spirochaetaceae bacterium]
MPRQASLAELLDFGLPGDYRRLEPGSDTLPLGDGGRLVVGDGLLEALARAVFEEIAFKLPASVAEGFAAILADEGASEAERFVAASLLRNAVIAAEGLLPLCQDTGTALVYGWKGAQVESGGRDEEALASGAAAAYAARRLRASQLEPTGFLAERNTGSNLPVHLDLRAAPGASYRFCFAAKGGGSANRTSLSMESPALLDEAALEARLASLVRGLGPSGCPPYRIGLVLGGQAPDEALYVLALATLGLLDGLPAAPPGRPSDRAADGSAGAAEPAAGLPLRDPAWEERLTRLAAATGVGAQFGGQRLALDARAIRLPRHAASLPLAFGVACAAQRRARAVIDADGVRLERLEEDPARLLPADLPALPGARRVDLDRPLPELAAFLGSLKPGTPLLLSGTVVTARDAAHARFRAELRAGRALPSYLSRHPVFYAGPTEAAPGQASGSFGPTTAGRMDGYLDELMERGASLVTIAKGSRSPAAAAAIGSRGGAYLAAMGGAAALAARENVVSSEIIDHADLGMEAVRRVVLKDLPALLVVDGRGADFYRELAGS